MQVIMLGTGTSHGVPVLGCECPTCRSRDPKDQRLRSSVLVKKDNNNLLIDTATEFRIQALRNGVNRVDALLLTHTHADHVCGFDDLRRFNELQGKVIPVYGKAAQLAELSRMFAYVFDDSAQVGGGKPRVTLKPVAEAFSIDGIEVVPIPIFHGRLSIYGYRIGRFAYVTDCSQIPQSSMELLNDLDLLILGVLRFRKHPTHLNLSEGLQIVEALKPKRTIFTHICHDFKHSDSRQWLPDGVELGFDGEQIEVTD